MRIELKTCSQEPMKLKKLRGDRGPWLTSEEIEKQKLNEKMYLQAARRFEYKDRLTKE